MDIPIYILTNSAWVFSFLHVLTNITLLVILVFLIMWDIISLWFWFTFPWWLDEYIFICLLTTRVSSLGKHLSSAQLFKSGCFFDIEFHELFVISDISPLLVTLLENILFQSVGCIFILLMISFAVQKPLSLIKSHLFLFFCFYFHYFRRWMQKK